MDNPSLFFLTFITLDEVGIDTVAVELFPNASVTLAVNVYDEPIEQFAANTKAVLLLNEVFDTPLHEHDFEVIEFFDDTLAKLKATQIFRYVPDVESVPSERHLLAVRVSEGGE